MPRSPKAVQVGPHRYKLQIGRDAIAKASHADGATLMGWTDKAAHRIAVDPDQSLSSQRDTVLHECLHAIAESVHIGLTPDDEEALVRRLAPALLDLLRRNPKLTAWLTGEDDG